MSDRQLKQRGGTPPGRRLSRRRLLAGTAATAAAAAVLAAARAAFPGGAFAQSAGPEIAKATFGFIALMDAAPLIIAKEKGFFAKHGLPEVVVAKQASWGTTRDNLVLGSAAGGIDGAHLLTPMPYLMSLGRITQNNQPTPMAMLARLNLDGQCISVARELMATGARLDASPLREPFRAERAAGREVRCAQTFRGGTHDLWLRYWLAAGGIDPDQDVVNIVVPPAQMVANMKVGTMQAFCVAEPWHGQLVNQGIGYTACETGEIWNRHPEKCFAVRADWAERYPKAAQAALMAVQEAQIWCDRRENVPELSRIVGRRSWLNVRIDDIIDRAQGRYDYGDGRTLDDSPHSMKYWRDFASYPFQSHELWFLVENMRWGMLPADLDTRAAIQAVNREDIWRDAAKALGVPAEQIPKSTSRGRESFFDGKVFDPEDPQAYLASQVIKRTA